MQIVTAKEMYEMDRYTMEELGVEGKILMENAGRAIANQLEQIITKNNNILILAGSGNNGGDGFVIARTLYLRGFNIDVWLLCEEEKISGDARFHYEIMKKLAITVTKYKSLKPSFQTSHYDVVIDAMLGIGVKGQLKSPYKEATEFANQLDVLRIAVDIPTGVPADEGFSVVTGFKAHRTFIIQHPKVSAFLQHSAPYYGDWEVVDIGIVGKSTPLKHYWTCKQVNETVPVRMPYSHKGTHGKALIIGGSKMMPGALVLSSKAALRSGAGLLTVASIEENIPIIAANVPEAMHLPLQAKNGCIIHQHTINFSEYDAVAIGMGLGREKFTRQFVENVLKQQTKPLLIDADGLFHLKELLELLKERQAPTVLTPHVGEMSRLMDIPIEKILESPFHYAREFALAYRVYLVLKGPFTIITNPNGEQWVTTTGNPGMAKGGSGDVLSGVLLAMMMQKQPLSIALANGCFIHGKSADMLINKKRSSYDLLATDIVEGLSSVFRTFTC